MLRARLDSTDAPQLPGLHAPPNTLPTPPAPLIGRVDELAALVNLMRTIDVRLVTLTGAAGVGKTRLSLALAEALRLDFEDGVLFVELAPLANASEVVSALAQALGLKDETPDALLKHLKQRHVLLMLDNFEHVMDASALLADIGAYFCVAHIDDQPLRSSHPPGTSICA